MAVAVWFIVKNGGMVINKLVVPAQIQPVQRALDSFAIQNAIDIVPSDQPARRNRVREQMTVAGLMSLDRGHMERLEAFFLYFAMLYPTALFHDDLSDRIREHAGRADRQE